VGVSVAGQVPTRPVQQQEPGEAQHQCPAVGQLTACRPHPVTGRLKLRDHLVQLADGGPIGELRTLVRRDEPDRPQHRVDERDPAGRFGVSGGTELTQRRECLLELGRPPAGGEHVGHAPHCRQQLQLGWWLGPGGQRRHHHPGELHAVPELPRVHRPAVQLQASRHPAHLGLAGRAGGGRLQIRTRWHASNPVQRRPDRLDPDHGLRSPGGAVAAGQRGEALAGEVGPVLGVRWKKRDQIRDREREPPTGSGALSSLRVRMQHAQVLHRLHQPVHGSMVGLRRHPPLLIVRPLRPAAATAGPPDRMLGTKQGATPSAADLSGIWRVYGPAAHGCTSTLVFSRDRRLLSQASPAASSSRRAPRSERVSAPSQRSP
jgi:hypothetical protein